MNLVAEYLYSTRIVSTYIVCLWKALDCAQGLITLLGNGMTDVQWAVGQLSTLLPLDDNSLKQIVEYSAGLSREGAAEHFKGMLGDAPQALEFISSFNSRRHGTRGLSPTPGPERLQARKKKQKAPLSNLSPVRQPSDYGDVQGAYRKKDSDEDYMSNQGISKAVTSINISRPASTAASERLAAVTKPAVSKPNLANIGTLISDLPNLRSRNASPNPKAKAKTIITGGTPMHGASTVLTDLESAIRSLELQENQASSNPNLAGRACDCQATKHPLLVAAPNCLACGKIICAKEGLGPCTFCSTPLLSNAQIRDMIYTLREERGLEKTSLNNAGQRRAEISTTPRAFQITKSKLPDASLVNAQAHRDKLLNFQTHNARRTKVHDEAADFETRDCGQSMWSSPVERARQLKQQQKVLREMEWNARPEYEKRKVVLSVDLVGGKIVKRIGHAARDLESQDLDEVEVEDAPLVEGSERTTSSGAFSRNSLLGSLIKPTWREDHKTEANGATDERKGKEAEKNAIERKEISKWRRVQDDMDDNEDVILDGGIYGDQMSGRRLGAEEHAFG